MKGISYLTNDEGIRTAVVIDIQTYGEELEDFLDGLVAEERRNEPKEDFQTVVSRILESKSSNE